MFVLSWEHILAFCFPQNHILIYNMRNTLKNVFDFYHLQSVQNVLLVFLHIF